MIGEQGRVDIGWSDVGVPIVHLVGDFDLVNAGRVRLALEHLAEHSQVIIDLSNTTYIDSSGMKALLAVEELGMHGTIRGAQGLRRVIEWMGLTEVFDVED